MKFYSKRQKEIFCYLKEREKTLTGEQIAVRFGITTRTLRNDVKEINELLLKENAGAEIDSRRGEGYRLKVTDQNLFTGFLEESGSGEKIRAEAGDSEDRLMYILQKLLMNTLQSTSSVTADELMDELYISESTLKKCLKELVMLLECYDLKLSNTKNGLSVQGKEKNIRYFIADYSSRDVKKSLQPPELFYRIFTEDEIENIKGILWDVISRYGIWLTDISFRNLLIHSLIMLKRSQKSEKIEYTDEEIASLRGTAEFDHASEIVSRIGEEMQVDLDGEQEYFALHLMAGTRSYKKESDSEEEVRQVIWMMLRKIKREMGVDFSGDQELEEGLLTHIEAAVYRLRLDMNIRNDVLSMIKNMYPMAFEMAVSASEIIQVYYGIQAMEGEIGFLAIHFGAALERKNIQEKQQRYNLLIVCIAGVATSMFLKERLTGIFGFQIENIQTCAAWELTQDMVEEADFVLTTIDLEQDYGDKVIKINLLLTDQDLEKIRGKMQKKDRGNELDLRRMILPDLYMPGLDFKDKDEVLTYMTSKMHKKGYIDKATVNSVFQREKMASTELTGLVSIPHAINANAKQIYVSVGVLKKPVTWGNEKVQVVLLMIVPRSLSHDWEKIFKKLYDFFVEKGGAVKLISGISYEQLIGYLDS